MHVCECSHYGVCVEGGRRHTESQFSPSIIPRVLGIELRLGGWCLYQLGHFDGPGITLLIKQQMILNSECLITTFTPTATPHLAEKPWSRNLSPVQLQGM